MSLECSLLIHDIYVIHTENKGFFISVPDQVTLYSILYLVKVCKVSKTSSTSSCRRRAKGIKGIVSTVASKRIRWPGIRCCFIVVILIAMFRRLRSRRRTSCCWSKSLLWRQLRGWRVFSAKWIASSKGIPSWWLLFIFIRNERIIISHIKDNKEWTSYRRNGKGSKGIKGIWWWSCSWFGCRSEGISSKRIRCETRWRGREGLSCKRIFCCFQIQETINKEACG